MMAAPFDYSSDRQAARLRVLTEQADARERLLREEVETWKNHRAWSDQIVKAYLDLLAERHQ